MKPSKRAVFDCNALVSALIRSDSIPALAFDRARKHCDLVTSVACIVEMRRIFYKEKFARYFTREEADLFLEVFQQAAIVVEPTEQLLVCRDSQDDKYLEVAVAAQADVIVSGDPDLLVLHPFRAVSILSPRDFLDFPI
ncbi:MAG: putative toxin-antitoxin system toxin component, PIN family [Saprospiraceae bacterium]|nr:putative toxin-antitoxin system toxin component, PIN family [Saprospiraceae bacterium]